MSLLSKSILFFSCACFGLKNRFCLEDLHACNFQKCQNCITVDTCITFSKNSSPSLCHVVNVHNKCPTTFFFSFKGNNWSCHQYYTSSLPYDICMLLFYKKNAEAECYHQTLAPIVGLFSKKNLSRKTQSVT